MDQVEKQRYGAEVLRRAQAKRGYLLPYHRMLGTHDPALLEAWMARWRDLVTFEVLPVLTSAEAASRIAPRS